MTITLKDNLAPVIQTMGFEFLGCEWQGRILRVYIDSEKGITIEDCSRVTRQVNAILNVVDPISGRYTLEVSSPGVDRPLFELAQYQKQIGQRIKVKTHTPVNNRNQLTGILLRIEGNSLYLLVEDEEIVLPFSTIKRANVIGSR